jgi:hypothetical protein
MNWQELAKPVKRPTGTMIVASKYLYLEESSPEEINECFRLLDLEDKAYFVGLPINPFDRRIVK